MRLTATTKDLGRVMGEGHLQSESCLNPLMIPPVIEGLLQEVPQQIQVVLAPLVGDGPRALPLGNLVPLDPPVAREAVKVLARIDALIDGLDDRGRRRHALGRDADIFADCHTLQLSFK